MKKRVAVVTEDLFLFQKIYLILRPFAEVSRNVGSEDICLWDADSVSLPENREGIIVVSRGSGDLKRPFGEEELISIVLKNETDERAILSLGEKCAYLRGERIKLTEVETALLSCLVSAGGEFVCREELMKTVWGDGADGGVLNVYIHYLREKLEAGGEKIILSSRKQGYKIVEKYLKNGGKRDA